MESLIGILLYIGAISTNTTYTDDQLQHIESDYQETITEVEENPSQMQAASATLEHFDLIEIPGGDKIIVLEEVNI